MTIMDTASTTDGADLFSVAHDLLVRAAEERKNGNSEAASKLLLAAGNIMGESIVPADAKVGPPNGTQQVAELLKKGWQEVSQIREATGIDANRIHVIIGRLKGKGGNVRLETQTVKRYRIVDTK